jgi:hypothetical protein
MKIRVKIFTQLIALIILLSGCFYGVNLGLSFINMPDDLMVLAGILFIATIVFVTTMLIPLVFNFEIKNFFKNKTK